MSTHTTDVETRDRTDCDRDDDQAPDVVFAALEDGYRPPADPAAWETTYEVVTGEPCPDCGTAIGLIFGPTRQLEEYSLAKMSKYPVSLPDEWTDGYDHPVYAYCDSPVCSWHGVAEWDDVHDAFESWIGRGAPTWSDRVRQGGAGR